jgi:hypothetical protein
MPASDERHADGERRAGEAEQEPEREDRPERVVTNGGQRSAPDDVARVLQVRRRERADLLLADVVRPAALR